MPSKEKPHPSRVKPLPSGVKSIYSPRGRKQKRLEDLDLFEDIHLFMITVLSGDSSS